MLQIGSGKTEQKPPQKPMISPFPFNLFIYLFILGSEPFRVRYRRFGAALSSLGDDHSIDTTIKEGKQ